MLLRNWVHCPSPLPPFPANSPFFSHRYGSPSAIQQRIVEADILKDFIDKIAVAKIRAVATGIARRTGSVFSLIFDKSKVVSAKWAIAKCSSHDSNIEEKYLCIAHMDLASCIPYISFAACWHGSCGKHHPKGREKLLIYNAYKADK